MTKLDLAYKKIYWAATIWMIISGCFILTYSTSPIGMFLFISIFTIGILIFYYTVKILFILPGKVPLKTLLTGFTLIIGGALFDIINTVLHSPDLSLEANPFILFLLDQNFSLFHIYCISFLGQALYITNLCLLWLIFLKAYPIMIQKVPSENFLSTSIKILGGLNANFWKLLIGKVDPFFSVSSMIPLLVSLSFHRWYLGLEWLNLVPISHYIAPILITLFTLIIYLMISYKLASKTQ